jgi:hypothetical protein
MKMTTFYFLPEIQKIKLIFLTFMVLGDATFQDVMAKTRGCRYFFCKSASMLSNFQMQVSAK